MRSAAHFSSQCSEIGVLRLDRFESPSLQGRGLGMLNCVLDAALSIRVTDASRVGHYAVVREHCAIDAVELRFVDVRRDHTFL